MKKPALHESLWFSHWVPSKWMQLTDFPNSVPSNSGFIKLGLISSRWNVQVSVDARQTCEWQVAVINSSLQSDTVRRDSGFWRSHTAAQGGCLQGRWWHQHCPRITCPPSPSLPLHLLWHTSARYQHIIKILSGRNLCTVMGLWGTLWVSDSKRQL